MTNKIGYLGKTIELDPQQLATASAILLPDGQLAHITTTAHTTGWQGMTQEQQDELSEYERSAAYDLQYKKRLAFMGMPHSARQQIINDVIIYEDLYSVLDDQKGEAINERHRTLRGMQWNLQRMWGLYDAANDGCMEPPHPRILNYFTRQELLDMHAEAQLHELMEK
jgi:hypothetical protein